MQHMPDKEFDKLFRDKFNDAEIEPSVNLWANIEQQLAPKAKRTLPIYWMAAASIAVVITAMLVFQKEDKIKLYAEHTTANVTEPAVQDVMATPEANVTATEVVAKVETSRLAAKQNIRIAANVGATKNIEESLQPNTDLARLLIKQADPKPIDVLPIREEAVVESPIVTAQLEPQQKAESNNIISETESSVERKGIRNVGDLVNYVVDKVDKRDKKFLKFNTDDDDNSSLIGINIGFVKLNSRKHK